MGARGLRFRLNVLTLTLPPLRDRRTDSPRLVERFVARQVEATGRPEVGLESGALEALIRYDWPGNIRQLESVLERAVLMSEGGTINPCDLPMERVVAPHPSRVGTGIPLAVNPLEPGKRRRGD